MKHIGIIICLFLIYSCDNHDFVFDEEEQTFYINDMLHFSIEPLDTVKGAFQYDFFWREIKPLSWSRHFIIKKKNTGKVWSNRIVLFLAKSTLSPSPHKVEAQCQICRKTQRHGRESKHNKIFSHRFLGQVAFRRMRKSASTANRTPCRASAHELSRLSISLSNSLIIYTCLNPPICPPKTRA